MCLFLVKIKDWQIWAHKLIMFFAVFEDLKEKKKNVLQTVRDHKASDICSPAIWRKSAACCSRYLKIIVSITDLHPFTFGVFSCAFLVFILLNIW